MGINNTSGVGVYGGSVGTGVYGDGGTYGVYGKKGSNYGYLGGSLYGACGKHNNGNYGCIGDQYVGVTGRWSGASHYGSLGTQWYGVFGHHPNSSNWAGYFSGNLKCTGTFHKGGGGFQIDHPLDPANKYLNHSFVESPDMKNVYDGVVLLDTNGEATVELPKWFGVLNRDFRYQLTCIGGFAQVYIAEELTSNQFKIAGGKPGIKISWQVTGIRQDAFANAHRIPVEEDKQGREQGKYQNPIENGVSETLGIGYEERKNMEEEVKRMEEENQRIEEENKRMEEEHQRVEEENQRMEEEHQRVEEENQKREERERIQKNEIR